MPPSERLPKGFSLARFRLQPRHLLALQPELRLNPHYAGAAPMRLYLVRELQALALLVHGGLEGLARVLERASARRSRRYDKLMARGR